MVYAFSLFLLLFSICRVSLLRERKWRDTAVFIILWLLAGYYMYGYTLAFPVLNPADPIRALTQPLARLILAHFVFLTKRVTQSNFFR